MQRLRDIRAFLWDAMEWRVLKNPKFLIPALVIAIFSVATLSSTIRFLDAEEGLFSYGLEQRLSVSELEDHFHDFEESILLYVSGHESVTRADVLKKMKHFQNEIKVFSQANWRKERVPAILPSLDSLGDLFVSIETYMEDGRFFEDRKISRPLGQAFVAAHEAIEALDSESFLGNNEIGTYKDRQWQRTKIFWSVLFMGLSGFVLIGVLVDRLASLERMDQERRRAVAEEARRAAAMDEAFEGMVLSDSEGNIVYANTAALRLSSYAAADVVGSSWRMLFSNDQAKRFQGDILPRLETEERWSGSAYGARKDGHIFPIDISVALLPDGGHIWVMRDLSRQIESERVSQRRQAAIEAAGDGIGIIGPDGTLSYMNGAMRKVYGISEEEEFKYAGKGWDALYDGSDLERMTGTVLPVVLRTGYWSGELDIARRDGRRIWVEMSLTRLPDGGIVHTIRDISDRKREEREKEELQAQFHQAQKMEAVGRLAGGIAHDFNNILAAIMGYAEFLEEDLGSDPEKKKFAEGILRAGGQARGLIDQLLSFSRRKETSRTTLNIAEVVKETVSLLRASLPRTISVETDVVDSGALVYANPTQIAQAVMNLCVNARDAMEDAHGTLTVGLEIVDSDSDLYEDMLADDFPESDFVPPMRIQDVEPNHCCLEFGVLVRGRRYVRLSVADSGHGMSRTIMEHIFEPFFTTKDVDKGTGLGLANVHGVVMAHQGALIVDSVIGEGTCFEIFFPLAEDQLDDIPAVEGYGESQTLVLTGRVLLVEDQAQVREMMSVLLRRLGYEVHTCESGMDALARLRQFPEGYDLVVTDHNMPKMTGLELADQSHFEFPWLPFILVTGYSKESLDSEPDDHPSVKAILRKPVDREALAAAIRGVLSARDAV
ncbi:MAG: PAS domain S-box protein [Rhodospirillales bacterium]|nr:PAS domain S-box protein [Rhodospirillales bacterium]